MQDSPVIQLEKQVSLLSNHMDEYQEEREMDDESKVLYDDIFYEEGW